MVVFRRGREDRGGFALLLTMLVLVLLMAGSLALYSFSSKRSQLVGNQRQIEIASHETDAVLQRGLAALKTFLIDNGVRAQIRR